MAVLADVDCFSLGEGTILTLRSVPRVRVFGETTSGTNGSSRKVPVPGTYDVGLTITRMYALNGSLAQGRGLEPDVFVPRTLQALREGRDPAWEAARDWVGNPLLR